MRLFPVCLRLPVLALLFTLSASAPLQAQDNDKDTPGGKLLVAFGASVGGLLFESHDKLNACEIAAGKDGANGKDLAAKVGITINLMKVLIDNLEKTRDDKLLGDGDRAFAVKAIETAKLVQEEAVALRAFLSTKDAKDNAFYQDCRKKADREIRLILGIKK